MTRIDSTTVICALSLLNVLQAAAMPAPQTEQAAGTVAVASAPVVEATATAAVALSAATAATETVAVSVETIIEPATTTVPDVDEDVDATNTLVARLVLFGFKLRKIELPSNLPLWD